MIIGKGNFANERRNQRRAAIARQVMKREESTRPSTPEAARAEASARARLAAANALASGALAQRLRDPGILRLVKASLQDYRARYPRCLANETWLFYDGNAKTERIRGTPKRVDVFCRFCRVMLVTDAVWKYDYSERLRSHTTTCALRSLAGEITPGPPNEYRLPNVGGPP